MAFSLVKVKSILSQKKGRLAGSGSVDPEIGMRIAVSSMAVSTPFVRVTLLGARHLPSLFGLSSSKGYVVKVKLFPGDKKYESQLQETSWPVWNEEFTFPIDMKKAKRNTDASNLSVLNGYFISLTVYAVLELNDTKDEKKKKAKANEAQKANDAKTADKAAEPTSTLAKFEQLMSTTFKTSKTSTQPSSAADKRRTVGAATWNFDVKLFQNHLKNDMLGTPDLWRPIEQMGSGIAPVGGIRENKKGQVEITLLYTNSEDGCKDTVQVNVNKMRCTVQTMQEHELHKEPLYIKAAISDREHESHWKSDRFFPTISARWDTKTSCARLRFDSRNLSSVTVYISIGCKNSVGVKEILGKVVVGEKTQYANIWKELTDNPGVLKTHWLPFE